MADQILQIYDSNQKVYWPIRLKDNGDGTYGIGQTVSVAADIELGAAELKDAGTDARANILAANTGRSTATIVLAVQHVDAAGNPAIFPVALGAQGGLKVEGVASGTAIPVTADTELPAASAINGTILKSVSAPVVGAALLVSDNTNLIQPLGDAANGLDVDVTRMAALVAGEAHVGEVGGKTINILGSFTRPADTTAYAAGDVVCNSTSAPVVITFTNCARINAGSGLIVGAQLVDGAYVASTLAAELWLFDTTITMDNDNAVFTPTDAELQTLVGVIQFNNPLVGDATAGVGGNVVNLATLVNHIAFTTGAASRNLFGVLVARNAYVPISAETFDIRLRISQD